MKNNRFVAPGLFIERQKDGTYIAWKPHVSVGCNGRKSLLRFIAWPAKTPTGDLIREWLNSFEKPSATQPLTSQPAAQGSEGSLSQELLTTGFGPECHLDESDPNHQTRTVI